MGGSFISIMEMVGTVAFAMSGALTAVRRRMDIFGVNILAVTTAVGGGILRDVLIGQVPPKSFRNPFYTVVAIVTANLAFIWLWVYRKSKRRRAKRQKMGQEAWRQAISLFYDKSMFWMDTLGLAAFTVSGVNTGLSVFHQESWFLLVFLGVVTGVGGGVMRDVMANEMPYIFVKHVYAVASLSGAAVMIFVWKYLNQRTAALAGFIVVMVLRMLAAHFKWELPKIE